MITPQELTTIKNLSDKELHFTAMRLAQLERETTERLLWHLREVEKRRLYITFPGVTSLHSYCTKILKMSEGSAGRRVNASRLLEAIPELSEKLTNGDVNLSTLGIFNAYVKAEEERTEQKLSPEKKQELAKIIEKKSQDKAERALIEALPEAKPPKAKKQPIANGETRAEHIYSKEFMAKLEKYRELISHKNPSSDIAVLELALDDALARRDPLMKRPRKTPRKTRSASAAEAHSSTAEEAQQKPARKYKRIQQRVSTKRYLRARSQGQCENVDEDGVRCERRDHLQTDHIVPLCQGGTDALENLREVCRPHNLRKGGSLVQERTKPYVA